MYHDRTPAYSLRTADEDYYRVDDIEDEARK
jgi:hypothetical protein